MAVAYDQSASRNFRPRLYPRTVLYEDTPEQLSADDARARRRLLYNEIRDFYAASPVVKVTTFDGKMNLPPEWSESQTGCSLTPPFVGWLDTGQVPDPVENRRRRNLRAALGCLWRERPELYLSLVGSARAQVGPRRLGHGIADALNVLLGWLGE